MYVVKNPRSELAYPIWDGFGGPVCATFVSCAAEASGSTKSLYMTCMTEVHCYDRDSHV